MRDEIEAAASKDGVGASRTSDTGSFFDGIMNWNKVGWLANKFAAHDAAVVAGRYTHNCVLAGAAADRPEDDPMLGMAQNYLLCPTNHAAKIMGELMHRASADDYEIDGVVFHATRTCRAFTNPQRHDRAMRAASELGIPTMFFEGDVADE